MLAFVVAAVVEAWAFALKINLSKLMFNGYKEMYHKWLPEYRSNNNMIG